MDFKKCSNICTQTVAVTLHVFKSPEDKMNMVTLYHKIIFKQHKLRCFYLFFGLFCYLSFFRRPCYLPCYLLVWFFYLKRCTYTPESPICFLLPIRACHTLFPAFFLCNQNYQKMYQIFSIL